jgi:tetratricopeptide (TPR) repeat protein
MRRQLALAGALSWSAVIMAHDSVVTPSRIDDTTFAVVQAWVAAVNAHRPGVTDAALETVVAYSLAQRRQLSAGMPQFLDGLTHNEVKGSLEPSSTAVKQLGHLAAQSPGTTVFLKRAALLHAEAAIVTPPYKIESETASASAPGSRERSTHETPILTQERLSAGEDGRKLGAVSAMWHWPFARFLLDLLVSSRHVDPFVGEWYHATSAYMLARRAWAELDPQLQRAGQILPDDAGSVFDRACYAETLGLPVVQSFATPAPPVPPGGISLSWTARRPPQTSGIPPQATTNAEAERLFKRVLEIEPHYMEARVRLARLLDLRGRHEEALRELTQVLGASPPSAVAFYAHMFAGRASLNLRQLDIAREHDAAALALFPTAQSAKLALSQVEVLRGDTPAALAPLLTLSSGDGADPWWEYHLCAGRDAETLLTALRQSLPR